VLSECLDTLGDVGHQSADRAAPEQQQHNDDDNYPVPKGKTIHRRILRDHEPSTPTSSFPITLEIALKLGKTSFGRLTTSCRNGISAKCERRAWDRFDHPEHVPKYELTEFPSLVVARRRGELRSDRLLTRKR
jgi:hypothetical protein